MSDRSDALAAALIRNFNDIPLDRLLREPHYDSQGARLARGNGLLPLIEVEESDRPLSVAQRNGISLDDACRIAHEYLDFKANKASQPTLKAGAPEL
jgi:hypothetical protein